MKVRPMTAADTRCVMQIQSACYGRELLEPEPVMLQRLQCSPQTCWVAGGQGGVKGVAAYLFAYPSHVGRVTPLSGEFELLPEADTLYLHDLAVHPRLRGCGAAQKLVMQAFAFAVDQCLNYLALVAVQQAASFWERHGFIMQPAQKAAPQLASYGVRACYMVRELQGVSSVSDPQGCETGWDEIEV